MPSRYGVLIATVPIGTYWDSDEQRWRIRYDGRWYYSSMLQVASFVPYKKRRATGTIFAKTQHEALRQIVAEHGIVLPTS